MAKKKSKSSKQTAKKERVKEEARVAKQEAKATEESQKFYKPGSLGRVEAPGAIARIGEPERVGAIDRNAAGAGQSIAQAESAYNSAMQENPYLTAALQAGQNSLQGFSGPEYQALLERATRGINSSQATAMRGLRQYQGAQGVTGSSAGRAKYQLLRDSNIAKQQATSDLLAQSAQDMASRIANFGQMANSAYSNYADARSTALGQLMGAREYGANYNLAVDKANQGAQQQNISNTLDYGKQNTTIDQTNIENARAAALANLEQEEKERAGEVGSYYGSIGTQEARYQARQANERAREANRAAARGY